MAHLLLGKHPLSENKTDRDIVVGYGCLWSAITFEPLYIKNSYLKTNTIFETRNALDQIKVRWREWQTKLG